MKNLWDTPNASQHATDLARRVYTSRLLGRDHTLVLHGGGNTSVKIKENNVIGEMEDILYVKAAAGTSRSSRRLFPTVISDYVRMLAGFESPSHPQMKNELATDEWHRVMQINLDAILSCIPGYYPLLQLAPNGRRVVVIGSKYVPTPRLGATASSACRVMLTQPAEVAALEREAVGIRVNMVYRTPFSTSPSEQKNRWFNEQSRSYRGRVRDEEQRDQD